LSTGQKALDGKNAPGTGPRFFLSATDAAKFWPIYSDYDMALAKLNDQRLENIKKSPAITTI
jgi:hypothetical protein